MRSLQLQGVPFGMGSGAHDLVVFTDAALSEHHVSLQLMEYTPHIIHFRVHLLCALCNTAGLHASLMTITRGT
jgi:hypothetical protein